MPIGDRDGMRRRRGDEPLDGAGTGLAGRPVALDDPGAMVDAVVVHEVDRRLTAGDRGEDRRRVAGRVGVEPDDRAEVRTGRPEQLVAVLLGPDIVRSCGSTPLPGPNGSSRKRPRKPRWVRSRSVPGNRYVCS